MVCALDLSEEWLCHFQGPLPLIKALEVGPPGTGS